MRSRRFPPEPAFPSPSVAPASGGHLFRQVSMSRAPWHLFQDRQSQAHLVVGAIVQADGPAGLNDSTAALAVSDALRGTKSRLATMRRPCLGKLVGQRCTSLSTMRPMRKSSPRPCRLGSSLHAADNESGGLYVLAPVVVAHLLLNTFDEVIISGSIDCHGHHRI
jgi:hypothetical protein